MAATAWLVVCGCSHTVVLSGFDAPRTPLAQAQNRRVAVVMSGVPAELDVSAAGFHYHYANFRDLFQRAAYTSLADAVDTVQFFGVRPPGGFDLVLYPQVKGHAHLGAVFECTIDVQLSVSDGNGQVLSSAVASGWGRVATVSACGLAIGPAFQAAAARAVPEANRRIVVAETARAEQAEQAAQAATLAATQPAIIEQPAHMARRKGKKQ